MFRDLFLMLVNTLVVEPAQAELGSRLLRLEAPAAVTREVAGCVSAARPVLTERYGENPLQGVVTALRLWTGLTTYEVVLRTEVPACEPALLAARPYLSGAGS